MVSGQIADPHGPWKVISLAVVLEIKWRRLDSNAFGTIVVLRGLLEAPFRL